MPRWLDKALGGTDEGLDEYERTHPSQGFLRDNFIGGTKGEPILPYYKRFFMGPDKPDATMPAAPSIPGIAYAQDTAQQYGDMNTVANTAGYRPKGLVARAAARNQSSY